MFTKSDDGKSNKCFDYRESGVWCKPLMKRLAKTTPDAAGGKKPCRFPR